MVMAISQKGLRILRLRERQYAAKKRGEPVKTGPRYVLVSVDNSFTEPSRCFKRPKKIRRR